MFPRRRICFVDSVRTLGGAELWILDAALGLRERGHEVTIVAQPGTPLLARARAGGLATAPVPIRCDGAPWTLALLWLALRRAGVEAVLCNLTKDLKAAGPAARLAGARAVLALRESDFPLKGKPYYRWYFNGFADAVVVNSEATRRTVTASAPWLDAGRVHLLYKGIDTRRFRPRRPVAPPIETSPALPLSPVVGFLGQLIDRKGLDVLMAAWELLETRPWPAAPRLLLAGEGPLAGELEAWRRGLFRPEAVRRLGWVEAPERFLRRLSVLVLPSRQEGFGLAAAEAAACGIPVVASRASSLPEVVRHGRTGLLVPPDDPAALADALDKLLREPDLAARLGRAGRLLVRRRFAREPALDALEGMIESVLAARGRA